MVDIIDGSQTYALIQSYQSLFVVLIFLILIIAYWGWTFSLDYVLASGGKIFYAQSNNSIYTTCPTPTETAQYTGNPCKYWIQYTIASGETYTQNYPVPSGSKTLPIVGNTTIYYQKSNPSKYTQSSYSPTVIPCVSFAILLFICAFIGYNVYLESPNKNYEVTEDSVNIYDSY